MLSFHITGSGQDLVFLHGYLENSKIWLPIIERLKNQFRCISIDFPGHGRSAIREKASEMEMLAAEIIQVLDHLKIANATVIGHSMGGYAALALADLYADRLNSLILINTTSLPDCVVKKEMRIRVIESIEKNMKSIINASIPSLFSLQFKNENPALVSQFKLIASETSVFGAQAALIGMMNRKDRTNVLHEFSNPIMIISGDEDKLIDVDMFHKLVPEKKNIRKVLLKGGHMSYIENQERVINQIETFLND